MDVAGRLRELGISLPTVAPPIASYIPVVVAGNLAFVSGQIGRRGDHVLFRGHVGDTVSVEQGAQAAREGALSALAAMNAEGLLDRIVRVVKVTGFVASARGFADQPKVVNGASDLLVQVFGEPGKHARSSVGVAELPLGAPVEVEFVFEIR
ncbi:MAG TPA: RidA family protein [Thermoplasmata archaeon]|nr:RidA family protein [Thermoplasmata archaeon]